MIQPLDRKQLVREKLLQELRTLEHADYYAFEADRFGFVQHLSHDKGVVGISSPEETPMRRNMLQDAKDIYLGDEEAGLENFKTDFFHDEEQSWRYEKPAIAPEQGYEIFKKIIGLEDVLAAKSDLPRELLQEAKLLKQHASWLRGQAERYLDYAEKELVTGTVHETESDASGAVLDSLPSKQTAKGIRDEYVGFLANAEFLEKTADFGIKACKELHVGVRTGRSSQPDGFRGYRF